MIKTEQVVFGNQTFVHTYSDEGKKIKQVETDIVYEDALDVPNKYTYVETEEDRESNIIVYNDLPKTEEPIDNEGEAQDEQ